MANTDGTLFRDQWIGEIHPQVVKSIHDLYEISTNRGVKKILASPVKDRFKISVIGVTKTDSRRDVYFTRYRAVDQYGRTVVQFDEKYQEQKGEEEGTGDLNTQLWNCIATARNRFKASPEGFGLEIESPLGIIPEARFSLSLDPEIQKHNAQVLTVVRK
jgi:hypothetical protein